MTISYNRLGSNGRLGNQMFQYAALRGIAAHRGFGWMIPRPDSYGDSNYGLFDCFEMSSVQETNFGFLNTKSIQTGQFHFSQEFFDNCPDNVNLHDYFQSEKYFLNVSNTIRKDFTFKETVLNPCKEIVSELDNPIFLHVRRGDPNLVDARGFKWSYTQCSEQHPPQPLEYYEEALKLFPEDQEVVVVSDSPEWVLEQELFKPDRFYVSTPEEKYPDGSYTPYVDLCIMANCKGGIIANSTLSWWGAWLQNGVGKIVAPKMWFGPAYADKITDDLYCEGWEVL